MPYSGGILAYQAVRRGCGESVCGDEVKAGMGEGFVGIVCLLNKEAQNLLENLSLSLPLKVETKCWTFTTSINDRISLK